MVASEGKKYGRLSIIAKAYCRAEILDIIPPKAFKPRPKVESAIVRIFPEPEIFVENKEIFEDCTKTITHQVEELKNLVNEFARFARMPHSLPIPDDLNDTIREAIILFKESHRKIKFIFKQDKTLPLIDIDREQIKRVMINLIKNSISALNGKGRIEVETMFAKEKELVYIEVRDNGKGIDPEAKHRLLEPYFSTRQKGTGLGLAIVNTIISDHNGRIRFEDNKPKGTKVIIELPIKQEQKNDQ